SATVYGYQLAAGPPTAAVGTINQAPLTITANANTKTYDAGTGSATLPTVTGLKGSDSLTGLTQSYLDPNAGSSKTLRPDLGFTILDGNGGANYSTPTRVDSTSGVINRAPLTIAANGNPKTYDAGTGSATLPTVTGLKGSD